MLPDCGNKDKKHVRPAYCTALTLTIKMSHRKRYTDTSYLDVNFDVESFCLAVSVTDVEAEDVLFGQSFVLAVQDIEDVV